MDILVKYRHAAIGITKHAQVSSNETVSLETGAHGASVDSPCRNGGREGSRSWPRWEASRATGRWTRLKVAIAMLPTVRCLTGRSGRAAPRLADRGSHDDRGKSRNSQPQVVLFAQKTWLRRGVAIMNNVRLKIAASLVGWSGATAQLPVVQDTKRGKEPFSHCANLVGQDATSNSLRIKRASTSSAARTVNGITGKAGLAAVKPVVAG